MTDSLTKLNDQFTKHYSFTSNPTRCFFAPGRVNLIGEHTDYNHGMVMPFAINLGTWAVVRINKTNQFRFASSGFNQTLEMAADDDFQKHNNEWWKYPLGIIHVFRDAGIQVPPLDFYFHGNLPHSSGLSSSASIEMVTAKAINSLIGSPFTDRELVSLSRKAENEFIGLNCGIMDMFAIGMSKANHTILLDCHTNHAEWIPWPEDGKVFVVGNTNVSRGLANSKYNERVLECNIGFNAISESFHLEHLGQLSSEMLLNSEHLIQNSDVRNRLHHVASENERVKNAVSALTNRDWAELGRLMNDSHDSLKNLYQVSCFELDAMVQSARDCSGCWGSRMTGAGFGGCTLSLVDLDHVDEFIKNVGFDYHSITKRIAHFYTVKPSDGVQEII